MSPSETLTTPEITPDLTVTPIEGDPYDGTDNFDQYTGNWASAILEFLVPNADGMALRVLDDRGALSYGQGYLNNVTVQLQTTILSGELRLGVQHSGMGYYALSLNMNGQAYLYKSDEIVASASIAPFIGGEWKTIQLQTLSGTVQATINGNIAMVFADPAPLPPGTVFVRGENAVVDNFAVSGVVQQALSESIPDYPSVDLSSREVGIQSIGSRIVYSSDPDNNGIYDLFMINADGTGKRPLTLSAASEETPAWSPDGLKVAFTSNHNGGFQLYTLNMITGGITQLTTSATPPRWPSWSPDNNQIVFQRPLPLGSDPLCPLAQNIDQLMLLNETTLAVQPFTFACAMTPEYGIMPDWSPTNNAMGTQAIIYTEGTYPGGSTVYPMRMKVLGTNGQWIYIRQVRASYAFDGDWSPNGNFLTYRDGTGIYVYDVNGQFEQLRYSGSTYEYEPDWSPDQSRIVFSDGQNLRSFDAGTGGSLQNQTTGNNNDRWPDWWMGENALPTLTPTTLIATPTPTATPIGSTQTITLQVNAGSDDVNEDGADFMLGQTFLWVGTRNTPASDYLGLRFTNVSIPQGTTILSAELQFYSTENKQVVLQGNIHAHSTDNSLTFSSSKPSQRTLTGFSVAHNSNVHWAINTWNTFHDVQPIVQTIINRAGWQSGNALSLIYKANNTTPSLRRIFSSYEGNPALAPRLVITYLTCPSGTSAQAGANGPICVVQPPTPTATPTVCNAYIISQPPSQAVTQELRDMGIVYGNGLGLQARQSPSINAPAALWWDSNTQQWRKIEISWANGMPLPAVERVAFPQGSSGDNQVWYRIATAVAGQSITGWLPARYEGQNYLVDAVGNGDPCSWRTAPAALTFFYDRRAAANYAIEHSYDTAVNHGALQSNGRVTQRLPTPIPPATPVVPYAYFRYNLIGQAGVTGSAVFVSESLWMGGMPMTWGAADSCTTPGGSTKGWRYCFNYPSPPAPTPPYGDSSNPFDTHGDLAAYWANGISLVANDVLQTKGRQIYIGGGSNPQFITGQTTASSDLGSIIDLGDGAFQSGKTSSDLSIRVNQLLTSNPNNTVEGVTYQVRQGDYVFISTNPQHGLLVTGWQEATTCRDAIFVNGINISNGYRRWAIGDFGVTYADAQSRGILNSVPWVVDFTSPPTPNNITDATQSPVPRPFYCTMFWEDTPIGNFDRFSPHDWYFYTMPDQVLVSTTAVANQVYSDPNWQWTN
jgi:hypothetical protein